MKAARTLLRSALFLAAIASGGCSHTTTVSAPCPEIRSERFSVQRNFESAFQRAVDAVGLLGGRVISTDRKAGTVSAVVHGSVELSVTLCRVNSTRTDVYVWGSAMPSVGGFTEVYHYRVIFLEQS